MNVYHYSIQNSFAFISPLLRWAQQFDTICCLNSNKFTSKTGQLDFILAVGKKSDITFSLGIKNDPFELLQTFCYQSNETVFGHIGYDLKNSIEQLVSENADNIGFPDMYFFIPQCVVQLTDYNLTISGLSQLEADEVYTSLLNLVDAKPIKKPNITNAVQSNMSEVEYIQAVKNMQQHIQRGDIFEVNLCLEFYINQLSIDPAELYIWLNHISPSPFSCFYKVQDKYLFSSSPERYLQRTGNRLISQPIKGTAKRGITFEEDNHIKQSLAQDIKEKNENVMIVDLVRNDLSRIAKQGTVHVDELFGVYTFEHVHQMISTISAEVESSISVSEIIKQTFPMGSMTGAPKVKAMELIEKNELFKRGLFSGSVGYIKPNGDFDLNVIIRSFLYNASTGYLSYPAGSAITAIADANAEYQECLLKAKPMFSLCNLD